jgi:hypothetical protein
MDRSSFKLPDPQRSQDPAATLQAAAARVTEALLCVVSSCATSMSDLPISVSQGSKAAQQWSG